MQALCHSGGSDDPPIRQGGTTPAAGQPGDQDVFVPSGLSECRRLSQLVGNQVSDIASLVSERVPRDTQH